MKVIFADIRALGYCSAGVRDWFKNNGLDYREFIKCGIDFEQVQAVGDAMALKAVEQAKKRQNEK